MTFIDKNVQATNQQTSRKIHCFMVIFADDKNVITVTITGNTNLKIAYFGTNGLSFLICFLCSYLMHFMQLCFSIDQSIFDQNFLFVDQLRYNTQGHFYFCILSRVSYKYPSQDNN